MGVTSRLLLLLLLGATAWAYIAQPGLYSTIYTRAEEVNEQYDYVIVGGGTAGLTVADRLTESGKYSVLVIEYGVFNNGSSINLVAGGFGGFLDPELSFSWQSVPHPELGGRTTSILVGKVLGGSSGHNALQVHRGQKDDYDRWGQYFGKTNAGWSWDGLLPYFKKAWHFTPPSAEFARENKVKYDARYWGTSSNVHANWPTIHFPFIKHEIAAFNEIPGVSTPPDSGAGLPGAFWYPLSSDPKTVTRSFARPGHWDGIAQTRKNYHTLTAHKVLTVQFSNNRAAGVTLVPSNATTQSGQRTVKARKEIILAAGTFHTPQILQRSGVGARNLLSSAQIPVVVDLPGVGSNFQDHYFNIGAMFNLTNFPFSPDPNFYFTNPAWAAEQQAQFDANRTGYMTVAAGNAASFLPLKVISPSFEKIAHDYEAQDPAAYLPKGVDPTIVAGYKAQKRALAESMRSSNAATYNLFVRGTYNEGGPVYLHPLSRGTVEINPTDPFFTEPIVDFRPLTNPADLDVLVEFTRFTRRYFLETSMRKYKPVETWPGANVTTSNDIKAAIRSLLIPSAFHPIGTAAMMPRELGGVVDQGLLVYGVKGLSVMDASVMPDLPGAYTQQTVYALAEKAADIIKSRA